MKCNACWAELEGQAISTTCGHIFCKEDASKILSNDAACPICDQVLSKSLMKPVDTNPGDEWTNMSMVGVSPQILMKSMFRSVKFYIEQKELENQYNTHRIVSQYKKKYEVMEAKCSEKIEQLYTAYQKMGKKCQMMQQEIDTLNKDKHELQEKYAEKSRQKRKLDEMYDQLRGEYDSMKRSAIQPANNNSFFPRNDPDLFSINMTGTGKRELREEIWPNAAKKRNASPFDICNDMGPPPAGEPGARRHAPIVPGCPSFGSGLNINNNNNNNNPGVTLRSLIRSPTKRPQMSRNRHNLFTL